MALTESQQATLKAAILADQSLAAWVQERRDDLIAGHYNAPAVPTFIVWRTGVQLSELLVEGFDFTQVDNLSAGQARIWEWLFDANDRMNPSISGVRSGISECWKGTAAKVAVGTFVLSKCKRSANRVERLFASGEGSDASPGSLVFEGELSTNDISAILNAE